MPNIFMLLVLNREAAARTDVVCACLTSSQTELEKQARIPFRLHEGARQVQNMSCSCRGARHS